MSFGPASSRIVHRYTRMATYGYVRGKRLASFCACSGRFTVPLAMQQRVNEAWNPLLM